MVMVLHVGVLLDGVGGDDDDGDDDNDDDDDNVTSIILYVFIIITFFIDGNSDVKKNPLNCSANDAVAVSPSATLVKQTISLLEY